MPPVMVTDKSALAVLTIRTVHWPSSAMIDGVEVAIYRLHYGGRDCFMLAMIRHLKFPMTPTKLYEHACLVLDAQTREVLLDRYFDEDGAPRLIAAFEAHMDVSQVHAM